MDPIHQNKTLNQILAENLSYFMTKIGMTQAQLGRAADMGQTTVSLYLNPQRRLTGKSGKEPSAKLAEVQRLAKALQVEPWELLRPLTEAQRDFYRSMEGLIAERAAEMQSVAPTQFSRKPPRRAA